MNILCFLSWKQVANYRFAIQQSIITILSLSFDFQFRKSNKKIHKLGTNLLSQLGLMFHSSEKVLEACFSLSPWFTGIHNAFIIYRITVSVAKTSWQGGGRSVIDNVNGIDGGWIFFRKDRRMWFEERLLIKDERREHGKRDDPQNKGKMIEMERKVFLYYVFF